MARKLSAVLVAMTLSVSFLQGCVPVYCSLKHTNTPHSEPLKLFSWETSEGYASQPILDNLAIKFDKYLDGWVLFDSYNYGRFIDAQTEQILLDQDGSFVSVLPDRDMRKVKDRIPFTDSLNAYSRANVAIVIEEDTYPQILEVEAWYRQTFGRFVALFMGKSGRAYIEDGFSRFACGPPRVVITINHADGSESTTLRYSLPDTEKDYWEQYGTLISEDGQFLYIYFQDSGAILRLNEAD